MSTAQPEIGGETTSANIFVSHAWTFDVHRKWVRLLASELHLLGYDMLIDAELEYGHGLNDFMQEVADADHVLMVAAENYVERADHVPGPGVVQKNAWTRETFPEKASGWLSVVFTDSPSYRLPCWLTEHPPKSFDFNADVPEGKFADSAEIEELWRWAEGLAPSSQDAVSLAEVRRWAARLERIESERDPGHFASPELEGRVTFRHSEAPFYRLGAGGHAFDVVFADRGSDSIYVCADYVRAVGLVLEDEASGGPLEGYLTPGRVVSPRVGQDIVVMNDQGALCRVTIEEVQSEINGTPYVAPFVTFSYAILGP